jgi:Flp pilus assembly protein TadG
MTSRRRTIDSQRGQAVVELVLVLPVLMLVLLAILQFGMVFKDYLALTDAVRAGARKGAVSRHDADPSATTKAAVKAAADDLGSELEVTAVSPWTPGSQVEVTGRYPYEIRLLNIITVTNGVLTSKTKERVE